MVGWLLGAAIAQAAFAVAVYIDKIVVVHAGFRPRLIAQCIGGVRLALVPTLWVIAGGVSASATDMVLMLAIGALQYLTVIPYFAALESQDAGRIMSIFFTLPVWVAGFGFIGIGEPSSIAHLPGFALVILGAVVMQGGPRRPQETHGASTFHAVSLMVVATAMFALSLSLFDEVGSRDGYLSTLMIVYLGSGLAAVGTVPFLPRATPRARVCVAWVVTAIVAADLLTATGDALLNLATLQAGSPALPAATTALEPILILMIGYAITRLWPRLLQEDFSRLAVGFKLFGGI